MEKFILVPDSFKGTMSSKTVCDIMKKAIVKHFADAEVISVPVADGGEGTVEAFLSAVSGEKISCRVKDPFMEEIDSFYGVIDGGRTAVIEMAACAGLPLAEGKLNPLITTTYGLGELILDALKRGCKKIIIGLGGSATNDAGAGMATALGVRFYNARGDEFIPTGGTLSEITKIDLTKIDTALKESEIVAMCDIDNPLFGDSGAAYVFAPQKGADENMVKLLDKGLIHVARILKRDFNLDIADKEGTGAAGGLGFGVQAFLGGKLQMGIETVLNTVGFESLLEGTSLVFTGEGKLDSQSIRGKVMSGVSLRAMEKSVPVIGVVGGIEGDINEIYDMGLSAAFSINRRPIPFSEARLLSEKNLYETMDDIVRFYKKLR